MSSKAEQAVGVWSNLDARPCDHMTNLVHAHIDEELRGPALWYIRFHVWHCPKCKCAAGVLQRLHDGLRRIGKGDRTEDTPGLSVERLDALNLAVHHLEADTPEDGNPTRPR